MSEIVVLLSFSMLFATMMFGYVAFRLTSEAWPPMGLERVSLTLPLLSTFIILLSSFTLKKCCDQRQSQTAKAWLWSTIVLGTAFMAVQTYFWFDLEAKGYVAGEGIFQSVLYALTWTHAAHIVFAVAALFFLFPALGERGLEKDYAGRVSFVSKFWHFLDVIWLILFFSLFIW